jgi:hypothetical protein
MRNAGASFVYNAAFESQRLRSLAWPPEFSQANSSAVCLIGCQSFGNHVYHPQFAGAYSLKSVPPALVGRRAFIDSQPSSEKLQQLDLPKAMTGNLLIEGRISVLFRGRGMKRCRAKGRERFELFVGAAALANNLLRIAALLLDEKKRTPANRNLPPKEINLLLASFFPRSTCAS